MKYKVILVDDEALIREAVSENMDWDSLGFELSGSFAHGKEAIAYVRDHPVDVVLTDICMPYMDGLELSRILSEEFELIETVIFSGYDNFEYAKQAMKYRVREYLLKPVTALELSQVLTTIKERLDKQRKHSQDFYKVKNVYNQNKLLLKSKALIDLVYSGQTVKELSGQLEEYGIVLDFTHYCMGEAEIDYTDNQQLDRDLCAFIVYNVAEEILKQYVSGEVIQTMDHRILFLLGTNTPVQLEKELPEILNIVQDEVKRVTGLMLTIGVGSFVTDRGSLFLSLEEAQEVLEYQYLWEKGGIFLKTIVDRHQQNLDWEESLEPIYEGLKIGDIRHINEKLAELREKMRECYLKKQSGFFVFQEVLTGIKITMKELGFSDDSIQKHMGNVMTGLDETNHSKEGVQFILNICRGIIEDSEGKRSGTGKDRASIAMDFIEKNYMDPDLSLQSVCKYLAMSSSRFSAMFKEKTGNTFMEALSSIRMEKAKELLEYTELKNYEIAEKIGFSDPHYFSIAFKKATGMTPTEYAKRK